MNPRIRPVGFAALSLAGALALSHAGTQPTATYPAKPIRVISTVPGAPPDMVARLIGERLGAAFGQPVIVENRPGASGSIALAAVAKAPPDGYTLGSMGPPHTVAPSLLPQLPYDTARDLAPVRQLARAPLIIVVRSDSPLRSLPELVAVAKARPGRLTYASSGNGVPGHLAAELFKLRAGIDLLHVPYKGTQASMAALLAGQVDLQFAHSSVAVAHIRSGKLHALATPGATRIAAFPEIPTLAELGYADFDVYDWQGLVAPAGTPRPVIDRIASEITKALEQPEVRERLAAIGMEAVLESDPAAFGVLIRAELERTAKIVRAAGIRMD